MTTEAPTTPEWSDPNRVAEYLQREVPHRLTAEKILLKALPERVERASGARSGGVEDDPSDRLAGLADQLSWLRGAGFDGVDCHFKWLELALLVGVKTTEAPQAG